MTGRVLVVDDLLPNVKLLEAKLTSEYFDVLTASDGPTALEIVENQHPDIVLLDVMMPGMDGFEVCKRIKSNPKTMHIPVVMITALSDLADRVRGLEAGADDFLTKPVNDTALFARVRSLVRLKMLMDEWRLREQTSGQFGVLAEDRPIVEEDASGARVLVVEDNEIAARRLRSMLERDNNRITIEPSAEAALGLVGNGDFDLIIVSLRLEDQDPLRFCSQLRSDERTRYVPILLVADEDDTERLAKALEFGSNDYLVRPIDENELLARSRTQIRRRRYQDRLRRNYERSLEMALTDSLTGLYNRRYLEAHINGLIGRITGGRRTLSLMMFDIDFFKRVNDSYGHACGDEVLREIGIRVMQNVRSFDTVARFGGEEFVVVMPETDLQVAASVAERLRRYIAERPFKISAPVKTIAVTISIGVVTANTEGDSTASLLQRADEALYEAKRTGRNKVVVWTAKGLVPVAEDYAGRLAEIAAP
jgi:two-component system cell cycle response regulator